jgi:hypothetical protein
MELDQSVPRCRRLSRGKGLTSLCPKKNGAAAVELFLIWLGLAIVVGVAASYRGRNGVGWFFLAVVITPLIAGLLVLVAPVIEYDGNF